VGQPTPPSKAMMETSKLGSWAHSEPGMVRAGRQPPSRKSLRSRDLKPAPRGVGEAGLAHRYLGAGINGHRPGVPD